MNIRDSVWLVSSLMVFLQIKESEEGQKKSRKGISNVSKLFIWENVKDDVIPLISSI